MSVQKQIMIKKKTQANHINVLMTKRIARSSLDGHIICNINPLAPEFFFQF